MLHIAVRLQSHFVVAINIVEVEKKEDDVFFFGWLLFVFLCCVFVVFYK